jgi:hypothetical protein
MILETDLAPVVDERDGVIYLNFTYFDGQWHFIWQDSDGMRCDHASHWTDLDPLIYHVDRLWASDAITHDSAVNAREKIYAVQERYMQKQRGSLWDFIACLLGR